MSWAYVYLVEAGGFHKIGVSSDPEARLKQMQTGCPHPMRLVAKCRFENALEEEAQLHEDYRANRVHGEWFKFNERELRGVTYALFEPVQVLVRLAENRIYRDALRQVLAEDWLLRGARLVLDQAASEA